MQIIGVNPNSYSSIKKVLCNFISVSDECAWVREGFDDVPYRTAQIDMGSIQTLLNTSHIYLSYKKVS